MLQRNSTYFRVDSVRAQACIVHCRNMLRLPKGARCRCGKSTGNNAGITAHRKSTIAEGFRRPHLALPLASLVEATIVILEQDTDF